MRRSAGLAVVLRLAGRRKSLRLRAAGRTTGTADGLCLALRARRGVAGMGSSTVRGSAMTPS